MNADVRIDLTRVDFGTPALAPLAPLRGRLRLADAVLTLEGLLARTAHGELGGRLALDARTESPRWSADARRLYFLSERGQFCEVEVLPGEEFVGSPPRELFAAPGITYEPLPDGERFLFGLPAGADSSPLVVVTNAPTGAARP